MCIFKPTQTKESKMEKIINKNKILKLVINLRANLDLECYNIAQEQATKIIEELNR